MKIVEVRHPKLGPVCVIEEDIPKFGVPLPIIKPMKITFNGHEYEFSPNTRYTRPTIDGKPSDQVIDTDKLRKLARITNGAEADDSD